MIWIELQLWTPAAGGKPARLISRIRPEMFRLVAPPGHHELRLVKKDFNTARVSRAGPCTSTARRSRMLRPPPRQAKPSTIRLALTGDFFDAVGIVRRGAPVDALHTDARCDADQKDRGDPDGAFGAGLL